MGEDFHLHKKFDTPDLKIRNLMNDSENKNNRPSY